jgi:hypothetical protein
MPAPVAAPMAADSTSNPLGADGSSATGSDPPVGWSGARSSSYAEPAGAASEDGGGGTLAEATLPGAPGAHCPMGRAEAAVVPIALAMAAPASAVATTLFIASDDISTPSVRDRRVRSIEGSLRSAANRALTTRSSPLTGRAERAQSREQTAR